MIWLACLAVASGAEGGEISRSRGQADGVVVLWPRIVPPAGDADTTLVPLAQRLQERLRAVAAETTSKVDVRPEPERACPERGCRATSVGLLLGQKNGGCAVLAMVGAPGGGPQKLVPLAGKFQLGEGALPFREPPENKVVVTEFVPCGEVEAQLDVVSLGHLLD